MITWCAKDEFIHMHILLSLRFTTI